MKNRANLFSAVFTQVLILFLTISLAACAAKQKQPQNSTALENAAKIKVSSVEFDGLPLTLVITMLQNQSVKCDPSGKGVAILLGPDAKQFADAKINIELKDVTLAEALERVADSAGLKVQATDTEILLIEKKSQ